MSIEYKLFDETMKDDVIELQNGWAHEHITYGVVSESPDEILSHENEYFYVALDDGTPVGYITAEVIYGNEYNVFPKGASFLQVNDLYIKASHRNRGIGAGLLSIVEERANKNGLIHIFISSAAKDADSIRDFYTRNGYQVWTTMFYKRTKPDTRVYELNDLNLYKYVVIFPRYKGKWLFCRHRERATYEAPGGHIEINESPLDAAKRELYEETGAVDFHIYPLFDYSVHDTDEFSNGQVFYAEVSALAKLPESEMAETRLFDGLPEDMTYPHIMPVLYGKTLEALGEGSDSNGALGCIR